MSDLSLEVDEKRVDKKRSFGVRHGKKIFEHYNDERKVRNRKDKMGRRAGWKSFSKAFARHTHKLPENFINRIFCADSEEFLKQLPDNCVDLVFTSPPYNFGLDYENSHDTEPWRAYFARLFAIFSQCIRVVKHGGRIIINVQPLFSDYIPSHHLISHFFFEKGLIWKGEILWEKNNYNCKYTSWGSWKSPSSPYLKYTWEFLEIFCKGDLKKHGEKENIDIDEEEFKSWVRAKWSIAPERDMARYGHPAMFPQKLAERVLKLFSFRHDLVLDPFNGAGTTTLAAHLLNRKYIGIDVSSNYCQKAQRRLDEAGKKLI